MSGITSDGKIWKTRQTFGWQEESVGYGDYVEKVKDGACACALICIHSPVTTKFLNYFLYKNI